MQNSKLTAVSLARAKTLRLSDLPHPDADPLQFLGERFELYADTHTSAVISGSTFAHPQRQEINDAVLDAAVLDFIYDNDGVRIGIAMATGDGLGHSINETENDSTALVTLHACAEFVNEARVKLGEIPVSELPTIMQQAGELSKKSCHTPQGLQVPFDSKSSLATTVVVSDANRVAGVLGNIGDGVVIVVDHVTATVKQFLSARHFKKAGMGSAVSWYPMAVQDVHNNLASIECIPARNIAEDDIIIHMTDGAWSELMTISNEHPEYRSCRPSMEMINTLMSETLRFEHKNSNSYQSALQIATTIIRRITEATLEKRRSFLQLLAALKPFIDTAQAKQFKDRAEVESFTIEKWLEEISAENSAVARKLREHLNSQQNDGMKYQLDQYATLSLINELQQHPFGDCCTVSVMRVPNQKVELVRALLPKLNVSDALTSETMTKIEKFPVSASLLERLKNNVSGSDFDFAIQRLQREMELTRSHSLKIGNKDIKGVRYNYLWDWIHHSYNQLHLSALQHVHMRRQQLANKIMRSYLVPLQKIWPLDIWRQPILLNSAPIDLGRASRFCVGFNYLATDNALWRRYYQREIGNPDLIKLRNGYNFKMAYRDFYIALLLPINKAGVTGINEELNDQATKRYRWENESRLCRRGQFNGCLPLEAAIYANADALVARLLKDGADVHSEMAFRRDLFAKRELLDRSRMYESVGYVCTALHLAVAMDNIQLVNAILNHMNEHPLEIVVDGFGVHNVNNYYVTPIAIAVARGNIGIVNLLRKHGSVLNSQYRVRVSALMTNQDSLLHLAVSSGNVEMVKYLFVNNETMRLLINSTGSLNMTPIDITVMNCDLEMMLYLVSKGAIVNAQTLPAKTLFLLCSAFNTNLENCSQEKFKQNKLTMLKFLIDHGAKPLITVADADGDTPLHLAIKFFYNIEFIKELLNNGADINRPNNEGKTPYQLAEESGNECILAELRGRRVCTVM